MRAALSTTLRAKAGEVPLSRDSDTEPGDTENVPSSPRSDRAYVPDFALPDVRVTVTG